jgi:hypothetical protein
LTDQGTHLTLWVHLEDEVVRQITMGSSVGHNYGPAAEHRLDSGCRPTIKHGPAKAANQISSLDFRSKNPIRDLAGDP